MEGGEPIIIRKLGPAERYFQDELEMNCCISVNTSLFETTIDLFKHTDTLNEGIRAWMKTQPFLRSKIVAQNDDKYFAYSTDEALEEAVSKYVTYLYFNENSDSNQKDDCSAYWKLLKERELNMAPDWRNGPMWRLMFVQISHNAETGVNLYGLIITASHAFFDGGSAFITLLALFDILQRQLSGTFKKEQIKEAKAALCVEEQVAEYIKTHNPGISQVQINRIDGFKRPDEFLLQKETDRIDIDSSLAKSNGQFNTVTDDKKYISVKELVEFSKEAVTKMHMIVLDERLISKILAKSKLTNTKLTGVLNMVFIMAWKKLYSKLEDTTLRSLGDKIQYGTLCDLRSSLKGVNHNMLVWFCTRLLSSYDTKQIDDAATASDTFWKEKFWALARAESEPFHARLKSGEQFQLVFQTQNPMSADETRIHFALSNMIVPVPPSNSSKAESHQIKLKEVYAVTSYRKDWTSDFCYNNTVNVENRMSWVVSYNSFFMKAKTIQAFVDASLEIFEKLNEFA